MMGKAIRVMMFVVAAYLCCAALAQADGILPAEGGISAMLVNGGALKAPVTLSIPLVTVRECDIYGDLFATDGTVGGGLSTPVAQVLAEIGVLPNLSVVPGLGALSERLRGGVCVVRTGGSFSGGPYLLLPVKAWTF